MTPSHSTTPSSRRKTAGVLTMLCLATQAAWAAGDAQEGSRGWLAVALLPKVGEVLIGITQQGASCVFTRLIGSAGTGINPNNPNCANNAAGTNYVQPSAQFSAYGAAAAGWGNTPQPGWQPGAAGYPPSPPAGTFLPGQPGIGQLPPGQIQPGQLQPGQIQAGQAMPMTAQAQPMPVAPPPSATPPQPPAAPLNDQAAGILSSQPVLSFVVQKLADHKPQSPVIGLLAQDQLNGQNEPSFAVTTGDAFAIRFVTSVPGRVRLINTDVDGQTSVSSLYEAVPAGDNRMPREHEGGILMTGRPGIEFLDVEFVPCVSASLAQHHAVQPFAGQLPACSLEAATRQYRPARADGGGGVADLGGKAMNFPSNPDPTQAVAIAPAGYAKGEALRFRLRIQHLARP